MGKLSRARPTNRHSSPAATFMIMNYKQLSALLLCLAALTPVRASDHADPLVLNPLRPPKVREPRITDLHVFLDKDQNPKLTEAGALVFDFCVFPAMAPVER